MLAFTLYTEFQIHHNLLLAHHSINTDLQLLNIYSGKMCLKSIFLTLYSASELVAIAQNTMLLNPILLVIYSFFLYYMLELLLLDESLRKMGPNKQLFSQQLAILTASIAKHIIGSKMPHFPRLH